MKDSKIFLDTAPIIYYLQENDSYFNTLQNYFEKHINSEFITSTITLTEYVTYPYSNNRQDLVNNFYDFISVMDIKVFDVILLLLKKAARIRSEYKFFKTMDSIQLSTALISDCDMFLTNDKQLKQFSKLKILTVEDLLAASCRKKNL